MRDRGLSEKPIDSYGNDVGQDPQDIHPFNCHSSAPAHSTD